MTILRPALITTAACLAAASAAQAAAPPAPVLSRNGLGQVRVGMTASAAQTASGIALRPMRGYGGPTCHYAQATSSRLGLSLMLARRDRIMRVDVDRPSFATAAGIRVGSTQRAVLAAYPRAISQPHKYVPRGKEIWVGAKPTARSGRALVFETDGRKVTLIRAGKLPQVGYVEGCS